MTQYPTCRHIKEDGTYCGSPALQHRKYCYYHLTHRGRRLRRALALSRNEPYQLMLPPLEDFGSIQVALSEVLQALASGQLEQRAAGKMLYAIQQATTLMYRVAQIKERAETQGASVTSGPQLPSVGNCGDAARVHDYPDFERNYDIEPDTDLDAATDRALLGAQEQAAVLAITPNPLPGCKVEPKAHYTREEAYQTLQWEIHSLRKQVRELKELNKEIFKKPAASVMAPLEVSATSA